MAVELSKAVVDALEAQAAQYDVWDSEVAGLGIRMTPATVKSPAGVKSWTLRYRIHGQQRRLKLGQYPRITVAEARKLANKELRKVDTGVDPQRERLRAKREAAAAKLAEEQAKRDSVEAVCESYIERHAKPRKRTWRDDQSKINREILPLWKGRPITSITRRDCRELVQGIADRGGAIHANRVAALLSRIFRFALDEEIIAANPAVRLPKPGVESQARPDGERDSVPYDDDEIREIWSAAEHLDPPARAIYRLGLITGQRPAEISNLDWSEIDGDWWTIPGKRTKNGRDHRVFLTPVAADALKDIVRTKDEPRVFAGWRGKRQLAAVNAQVFAKVRPREKPRHALRNTVATGLARCGVAIEDVAKVLNHTYGPRVTSGYNAYSYDREKRLALTKWARRLTNIIEGKNESKVRAFSRGGVA